MDEWQQSVTLKNFTYTKIGGPAKYFFTAKTEEELIKAVQKAKAQNLPVLVIGGGSNLLVSDEGFPGLVIRDKTSGIKIEGQTVVVKSGTILKELIDGTIQSGLSGIQDLYGIPGTVGGAVFGNAGAFGQAISDRLIKVKAFDGEKIVTLTKDECEFDYRDSCFKRNGYIILETIFKLDTGDSKSLIQGTKDIWAKRKAKYSPATCCPGSFFKNIPVENFSGESLNLIPKEKIVHGKLPVACLLEEVGANGRRLGNIEVAPYHANLIINLGDGKASDFWQLASDLAKKVKEKFGVDIEPEVQLINLPPFSQK